MRHPTATSKSPFRFAKGFETLRKHSALTSGVLALSGLCFTGQCSRAADKAPDSATNSAPLASASFGASADAIINRYTELVGGAAAVESVKSAKVKGAFIKDGQKTPFELLVRAPGQILLTITKPSGAVETVGRAPDGRFWVAESKAVRDGDNMDADRLLSLARVYLLSAQPLLLNRYTNGTVSDEVVNGKPARVLRRSGGKGILAFDSESGLLSSSGDCHYSDYRAVGAVRLPFAVKGDRLGTVSVGAIELNPGLTEEPFKRPAGQSSSPAKNLDAKSEMDSVTTVRPLKSVSPFAMVQFKDISALETQLNHEMIKTLWFNRDTVWPERYKSLAAQTLEAGMNPGLGVRKLHAQGITGKGVNVAIIDQNMLLDHPEIKNRIAAYFDTGCEMPPDTGSMHGPAVASLLAGERIGVAPGAKIFFAAAPSWKGDAAYYAKGLNWILDQNEKLPAGQKIRVVSVSAAPAGEGSPFKLNHQDWLKAAKRAKEAGVLVLDCGQDAVHCPGYFDPENPDDISKFKPGFAGIEADMPKGRIYVPASYRTQAEEYVAGKPSYQYTGRGGASWSVPYIAGVMALGWQVRPELGAERILELIKATAYTTKDGYTVANPPAFIKSLGELK